MLTNKPSVNSNLGGGGGTGHQKTLSSGSVVSNHSSRLFDALLPLPQITNNDVVAAAVGSPEVLSSLSSSE